MTTYIAINTIQLGSSGTLKSGNLVDDVCEDVATIAASGGILAAVTPTLLAAAAIVQGWWKLGKGQAMCDGAMLAAYEITHDAVVAEAAHTHATSTEAAHTHSVSSETPIVTKVRHAQNLGALAVAGTNYLAQFAAGAAIDSAGPFVRFSPPRVPQIARGGAGVATKYTITGTNPNGDVISEDLNSAGAATLVATKAYSTITRFQSNVNPTVTTDLQSGPGFGLGDVVSDIDVVSVDGVLEVPTSAVTATGTVIPATAPNGTHIYRVAYQTQPTQAAHSHGGATGTGSAHDHGATGTGSAHTHALT